MSKCDIIIPIYNAHDCVIECVESVLKNTDFKFAHLILIDDKSPDERMLPLIEEYGKKYPKKITVLKNEKNLGFVGTVNKGMKYSKNDVLLLNSDTEVPKGWLERIAKCAYSDEKIATVTPLSNNATLASVPNIFERNELPEDYDLDKMDMIVQKCSDHEYPEIPTAHGFCMYIKREALDKVGYFDEKNFGKGYGEENDFSFRCFEYGYRNVLCDDVYVLHKESQSFLDHKVDNSAALAKKHPMLKNNLDYWCRFRDIKRIGKNVSIGMGVYEKRANILIVVHDFKDFKNNVGGTTIHILDLIEKLRKNYNFHVLAPEGGLYTVHSFFKDTDLETAIYRKPVLIEEIGLYSNEYEKMLKEVIEDYKISFVHIHHMIGNFFNIMKVCEEKNIKYAVSLHDMYLNTPIVSMIDDKVSNERKYPINIEVWRKTCGELLNKAEIVIAPSEFTKRQYERYYKNQKIDVIRHGVMDVKGEDVAPLDGGKNVAFVGAIYPHKGSKIMEGIVERLKKKGEIKVHLFGMTTARIEKNNNFVNHGMYKREDLARKLKSNHIGLVCVFSLAPETFSYTVEEVVAAGVPVLTFDIGAGAERVKENGLGWVIKYTEDTTKIYDKIKAILNNAKEYESIMKNIRNYRVRDIEIMAKDYDKIYRKNTNIEGLAFEKLRHNMINADLLRDTMMNCDNGNYKNDYLAVINSAKWRLISKVKVPRGIKKSTKKVYKLIKGLR